MGNILNQIVLQVPIKKVILHVALDIDYLKNSIKNIYLLAGEVHQVSC